MFLLYVLGKTPRKTLVHKCASSNQININSCIYRSWAYNTDQSMCVPYMCDSRTLELAARSVPNCLKEGLYFGFSEDQELYPAGT